MRGSFTVEAYHNLLTTEVLYSGDPYELLDGLLYYKDRAAREGDPLRVSPAHATGVGLIGELMEQIKARGFSLSLGQPVTIPPCHEPEPDASILRGTREDYKGRHPGPAEVCCVFEVADHSLQLDRVTKQRIYADSGIGQYVIVNLVEAVVELYTAPLIGCGRYEHLEVVHRGEMFRISLDGKPFEITADDLLL